MSEGIHVIYWSVERTCQVSSLDTHGSSMEACVVCCKTCYDSACVGIAVEVRLMEGHTGLASG